MRFPKEKIKRLILQKGYYFNRISHFDKKRQILFYFYNATIILIQINRIKKEEFGISYSREQFQQKIQIS